MFISISCSQFNKIFQEQANLFSRAKGDSTLDIFTGVVFWQFKM